MDREPEELQFLGIVGICHEASKILHSWQRLFAQIALALVLPLSVLFLAHIYVSHLLFSKIDRSEVALDVATPGSPSESAILSRLSAEWSAFLLFKAAYLLALLVLSLLSTSAVVYSVASIYTAKDLSFAKVLAVVPKVWRRLMITFLWAFLLLVAYNTAALILAVLAVLLLGAHTAGLVAIALIALVYAAGLVWISVVWHVASVVSVLEDACGIEAMRKSRALIRGKTWTAVAIFVVLNLCFVGVEVGFRLAVVRGNYLNLGVGSRVGYSVLMLSFLCAVILFALVAQTVVYFVCKSYHHESIDKSSLADHLEVYLGDYMPLKARDVQLEQFHV
ncbi:uncharacterized protein LOC120107583 [Phoenix dactylifera]|uniref:Uncharacterized protein LOC120107583 n=1 Tax=Phoenix dactylifera TaxID=42345 RepID=A0A8B8ZZ66_PHODC|nr:uncharacterized protein LOC120107583 [Phoenix dactylifera]